MLFQHSLQIRPIEAVEPSKFSSPFKRFDVLHRLRECQRLAAVVDVEERVAVVAHAEFLHVAELAEAVARLHALDEVMMEVLGQSVDEIDGRLIGGKDVRRGDDADVTARFFPGKNHAIL